MDILRIAARVANSFTDPTAACSVPQPQPQPQTLDAQQVAKVRETFLTWSRSPSSGPEDVERFVAAVRVALIK